MWLLFQADQLWLSAAAVVAVVISTSSSRPSGSSVRSTTGSGVATLQRRDLVETDTESGTLSYAGQHTVYDRLSGTVTWLPSVGQLIKRGQTLFTVRRQRSSPGQLVAESRGPKTGEIPPPVLPAASLLARAGGARLFAC